MSAYMSILSIVTTGILVVSLIYTFFVARNQKALRGNLDTKIPQQVQEHAYLRNPVFLTYLIFFVLLILAITFFSLTINW